MATLEYTVTGQKITTAKTAELVKHTIGYYTVQFTFDSTWDAYSEKWAVFDPDFGEYRKQPLDASGQCDFPGEVMNANRLNIGVYGVADGVQYPTIWAGGQWLKDGAYSDCPVSEYPEPEPILEGMVSATKEQSFTDAQKEQARENIGALGKVEGTPGNITIIGSNQNIADSKVSKDNLILAPQLASNNYKTDSIPYVYRQTGGGIGVGNREYDSIVGGSVVHQQIINPTMMTDRSALGVTLTRDGNGGITVTGTPTATNNLYFINGFSFATHVYLFGAEGSTANHGLMIFSRKDTGGGVLLKVTTAQTGQITYFFTAGEALNVSTKPYIYDLTEKLGPSVADRIYAIEQASAGSGIAVLNAMGLNQYRPYTATPSLESVSGLQSHIMTGFNAWDEQWESGDINIVDGAKRANARRSRSKNFIPVFPNTTYYCKTKYSNTIMCFYDADKHWVSAESGVGYVAVSNSTFVTPSWCYYMLFYYTGTTNEEFCINISDPVRNGTYEPYTEYTYPLDSSLTLRGVAVLDDNNNIKFDGDTYAPDGTVTRRYGIVDLGTVNWVYASAASDTRFFTTSLDCNAPTSSSVTVKAVCALYATMPYNQVNGRVSNDMVMGAVKSGGTVYFAIKNLSYTSAAAFKTAMSGVYLIYELATPTTETAEPYDAVQICDPLGTEEYVTTGIVPVGHITQYPENQVAKLDGLPSDFSTLIAPTEKAFTATRAYTTGRLLIVNNILYKATTSIASGATLTVGTNIVATTLDEVIASL